jgi:lipopolysaccharide export LptBFGC system permease protein LptF
VLLLIIYCIPPAIVMGVPFSVCLGFVHALTKMHKENGILANYKKLLLPILCLGLIISALTLAVSGLLLPKSVDLYNNLYRYIILGGETTGAKFGVMVTQEIPLRDANTIDEIVTKETFDKIQKMKDDGYVSPISLKIKSFDFHRKIVMPMAAFFFAFLALPLSMLLKKHCKIGLGISFSICLIHWILSRLTYHFSMRYNVNPIFMAWLPNILWLFVGIALYFVAIRQSVTSPYAKIEESQ